MVGVSGKSWRPLYEPKAANAAPNRFHVKTDKRLTARYQSACIGGVHTRWMYADPDARKETEMTTAAKAAKYAGKLAFHGAKLGGRVLGILGGVAASALLVATRSALGGGSENATRDPSGIQYDPDPDAIAESLDEAIALEQPLYCNRFGDAEEQGIWRKK
jgi:hypothetical protein